MATVVLGVQQRRRVEVFSGGRPDARVAVLPATIDGGPINAAERERIRRLGEPVTNPFVQGVDRGAPRTLGFQTISADPYGPIVQVNSPRPDPRAREEHRVEIGEVVMVMRERGDVVLYKKTTAKSRVVLTAAELDDLAVALDGMLGHRKLPMGR